MNPLHDFLTWFDGWAENIGKAPTPKQWERLKAKVDDIRKAAPVPTPGTVAVQVAAHTLPPAPTAPAEPPPPPKPTTPAMWRSQYIDAMVGLGLDLDSAKEFAATIDVDLNRNPAAAAKADASHMLN